MRKFPPWISGTLIVATGVLVAWWERRSRLRRSVEAPALHITRNLVIAGCGAVALQLAERPIVNRVAALVERRRWGLLQRARLPRAIEIVVGVALLDYTLYLWHVLTHRVPWLWRAHAVHHIDRDLDATTALRFHFAELLASVPWRAGQVMLLGISPLTLSVWQTALMMSILFHHSNVELTTGVERVLVKFIVTPRMHGIHHSRADKEANANWSSGLTIWDRLHRTLHLNVPQQSIVIGVSSFDGDEAVTLPAMLTLPFTGADVSRHDAPGHAVRSVPPTFLVP